MYTYCLDTYIDLLKKKKHDRMRGFMGHHRPIPLPGRRSNSPTNALQPRAALFRVHRASCASAVLPHALG